MTLAVTRDRDSMTPALAGSALLHLSVAALLLLSWPWTRELKMGTVVPVQIVSNAPNTDVRPAIEAAEAETAAAPEPQPEASLQAPAPPAPEPVPKPAAKPPPVAEKAPGKAQPAAKAATKPAPPQEVDLDRLLASVSKAGGGAPRSAAPRGPVRPETAPQARPAVGTGLSAMALAGLQTELQRRWNPNCDVEGGRDVKVRVTFTLGASGMVVGAVSAAGAEQSPNPVVRAAAERAIRAVHAAAPFRNLPREYYGDRVAVNFNAQEACS